MPKKNVLDEAEQTAHWQYANHPFLPRLAHKSASPPQNGQKSSSSMLCLLPVLNIDDSLIAVLPPPLADGVAVLKEDLGHRVPLGRDGDVKNLPVYHVSPSFPYIPHEDPELPAPPDTIG